MLLIILAAIGATYEHRNRLRESRLYQPPGQLIDLGGYRMHVYCTGAGSPTVLLDFGLDGSYLDWYRAQPEVARFTRVCSADRAGYGWSDPSPRPRVPSAMVEELHAALGKAGEKPPYIFVGHSFGGFDTLMFAHKYAAEVAAVVLVDSPHPAQIMNFTWRQKLWLRMMQCTMPFGVPRWRHWCGNGPAEIAGVKAAIECRSRVHATNYAQFAAFEASAAEIRKLPPLTIPLVVISRDPKLASDPESERRWQKMQTDLLRFSADSRLMIAEGSNHGIPLRRPDVIVDAIRDLVGRIQPQR